MENTKSILEQFSENRIAGLKNYRSYSRDQIASIISEVFAPLAKKHNVVWITAPAVMQVLKEHGYFTSYKRANSIGDTLGYHSGSLKLPSEKRDGKTYYNVSSLYSNLQ